MSEDADTLFGTTVRAFKFNGDETTFRIWESRTLALAEAKGFLSALTKIPDEPGITADQYEVRLWNSGLRVPMVFLPNQ